MPPGVNLSGEILPLLDITAITSPNSFFCFGIANMATNGTNGVEHTYALSEVHKDVGCPDLFPIMNGRRGQALTQSSRCWKSPWLKQIRKSRRLW